MCANLVYSVCPYGLNIISLGCQLLYVASIGEHRVKLRRGTPFRRKNKVHAVRRPPRILISPHTLRELDGLLRGYIHHENIEVARLIAARPSERNQPPI